ncbi:HAD family hydrolase [Mucilaginibacter sp.]|uniref:HAD family hydrolase n=1 Tax=Mucilaginibacter sp. TaxID=1882438 RepID=UPI003D0AC53A
MLKAILFDLDGTLIDSEFFHFDCWNEILAEANVKLTYNDWIKNYAGIPLPVNAQRLIEKYNITIPYDELVERREKLTLERFKTNDVALMPFVLENLNLFTEKGLTLSLVTSSPRLDVEAVFERNGLKHFFNPIITRSEVTHSKPDPESYNVCVEKLGLAKNKCIVFEDTLNGVKAAKAAGLVCFAIQSNTDEHHKLTIADKIFLDFNEATAYLIQTKQI